MCYYMQGYILAILGIKGFGYNNLRSLRLAKKPSLAKFAKLSSTNNTSLKTTPLFHWSGCGLDMNTYPHSTAASTTLFYV